VRDTQKFRNLLLLPLLTDYQEHDGALPARQCGERMFQAGFEATVGIR
jgi:hypothetical protein